MKFKLDENVAASAGHLLTAAGHDVATVRQQGLTGVPDGHVAAVCRAEGRALVTEDLDFSDIRAYPPADHAGIVVLRLPSPDRNAVCRAIGVFLAQLDADDLPGKLVIVDVDRIRIRQ